MKPQQILQILPRSDYRKEQFYKGPSNALAFDWIERWPDWPTHGLALYGQPGSGKTHLAHIWQAKANALWLTPDLLKEPLPQLLTQAPAFILDELDFNEEWLLHFYNLTREKNLSCLLCYRQSPKQWPITLPDLSSRLATVPAILLNLPESEMLQSILLKLFRERGAKISTMHAKYLLDRVERSFAALKQLVHEIDTYALIANRPVTRTLIREYLS